MNRERLRLIPLGGLGEVGMNCLALEQGDDIILIDCGVTFSDGTFGSDVIHPRFDYVLRHRDRLRGLVLTHGHEDHIGAVPYLLDEVMVPVYGPAHALALVRERLTEWHFDDDELELHQTECGRPFDVGSFKLESIRVTHSIADATALAIRTVAGLVIHTGDFKIDPYPADREKIDQARFEALGDEGVRLLLSDSTNVDSPGTARSEEDVASGLEKAIQHAKGRVVVGVFASNVQRLINLGRVAERCGRRVVLLGRSVQTHVRIATELGRLHWPSDLVVSPDLAQSMDPTKILVIATGTQAETAAALGKLAHRTHPRFKLDPGDTVVFSSRIIPGHDREVFALYGAFLRQNIEVVTRADHPHIHASGHAHREEQAAMIGWTRPKSFMPVHGTLHHLRRHGELARNCGVDDILVVENGAIVEVPPEGPLSTKGQAEIGQVHTRNRVAIPDEVLAERRDLAKQGVLSVTVVERSRGGLARRPSIESMGVLATFERDLLARLEKVAESRAQRTIAAGTRGEERKTELRSALRRAVEVETGQRPFVVVHWMEVP